MSVREHRDEHHEQPSDPPPQQQQVSKQHPEHKKGHEGETFGDGFRVVDRRRFTSTGDRRDDTDVPPGESNVSDDASRNGAERERGDLGSEPMDFLSFIASLATNAMAAMGALPEAEAAGLPRSAQLAREYINIIAMLQEKTRGNLDPEETQVLQQVLTDLRMTFVHVDRPVK